MISDDVSIPAGLAVFKPSPGEIQIRPQSWHEWTKLYFQLTVLKADTADFSVKTCYIFSPSQWEPHPQIHASHLKVSL